MLKHSQLTAAAARILEEGNSSPKSRKMLEVIFGMDDVEQGTFIRDLVRTLGGEKFKKLCGKLNESITFSEGTDDSETKSRKILEKIFNDFKRMDKVTQAAFVRDLVQTLGPANFKNVGLK